jgi:chromatin remodeling complex protein RSC6
MSSSSSSVPSTMNSTTAAPKKVAKKAAPAATVPVPAPAPETAAPKKAAAPKKVTPSPAASTSAPAPAPVPVETSTDASEVTFETELAAVQTQLTMIREAASAALAALKRVAKRHGVEVKEARKNRRKSRPTTEGSEPRRPNNFEIPVAISDELSAFFGGGKNAMMSRTQVNQRMSEYIKSHKLGEGQKIRPDAALRKLLRTQETDELTIFNIQKYLKVHYPQTAKA